MKHTIITTALLAAALAVPAYAQRSASDDALAYCAHVRDIAAIVMHERQHNVTRRDALNMAIDSAMPGVLTALVRVAYEQPRHHNTPMQRATAQEFGFLSCFRPSSQLYPSDWVRYIGLSPMLLP